MSLKASRPTFLIESGLYECIEEVVKREEVLGHINELEILILVSWESKAFTSIMLMESWSYGSEGKGLFLTHELDLPSFARSRKAEIRWELRASIDFEGVAT
ncbi:hypothetical protein CCACVL1_04740 [Corchorus capsularis]|uniref:Uncharacterized protein n=1 Tax=Corchorus capsularis TaxID=210143 RepID=A0A1R3JQ40_COCAP|nr:hypothetical protein CCACVL1_04740 [Corchorus capsularis]